MEYVPPAEWKTLNALENFSANHVAPTTALDGRSFAIELDGGAFELDLGQHGRAAWTDADGSYAAREVAPELFMLDLRPDGVPERALAIMLDLDRRLATVVVSTVVGTTERRVEQDVRHGVLPGAEPGAVHERTSELVGHRVQYIYGPDSAYEHIYLNDATYCWQCLAGAERGQADCDPTRAWKLRDRIYLFAWVERVVPCDGVVVLDWQRMRNNGRIFGWDTEAQAHNLIPMGARAVALNETVYAPLS